jgi:iron complex outermembrane receptor protein
MKLNSKYLVIALVFSPGIYAAEIAEAMLPEVEVVGKMIEPLPTLSDSALREQDLTQFRTNSSDTARLLGSMPGISVHSAGGVSGMPVIHGMADDRIRIQVDGMNLISACANHMNTPLSYIDPANVDSVMALVGITPVELGGDSIGGTIRVDSAAPEFAKPGEGTLRKARAGAFYRSNNAATGANLSATIASEAVSARYTGSTVSAKNYTAGADFKPAGLAATDRGWLDGDEVG